MKRKYRKSVVLVLVIALSTSQVGICPLYAVATQAATQTRLGQLIESGDAQTDVSALQGATISVLTDSDRIEAGAILPVTGIQPPINTISWTDAPGALEVFDLEKRYDQGDPTVYRIEDEFGNTVYYDWFRDIKQAPSDPIWRDVGTATVSVLASLLAKVYPGGGLPESHSGGELIRGGSFSSSSDLKYWENAQGAMAGLSSFGPIGPPDNSAGGRFGLIHTGYGAASAEGRIQQTITAPVNISSYTFLAFFNFVTTEFLERPDSINDGFICRLLHLTRGGPKDILWMDVSYGFTGNREVHQWAYVDQFSSGLPVQVLDKAINGAYQTGWGHVGCMVSGDVVLQKGQRYMVDLRVHDYGDAVYDSALLLDKVTLHWPATGFPN